MRKVPFIPYGGIRIAEKLDINRGYFLWKKKSVQLKINLKMPMKIL